jgi:hypothetical protein
MQAHQVQAIAFGTGTLYHTEKLTAGQNTQQSTSGTDTHTGTGSTGLAYSQAGARASALAAAAGTAAAAGSLLLQENKYKIHHPSRKSSSSKA